MVYTYLSRRHFFCRCFLGACLAFISACGTTTQTEIVPPPQPTCISTVPNTNPYLTHRISGALTIYENYKLGLINLEIAKQDALDQLGKNTEHWSDRADIAIDENQMVRVVITYLDPVLIQYIVLNQALDYLNAQNDPAAFDNELRTVMGNLGNRNELLFIVTITAPFYREQAFNNTVLTVDIPIEQMSLISTADMSVRPTHEDHILDEAIDITHGPVYGIMGFPIAVFDQTQCVWIMDQFTTTLTLEVPNVILGATTFGTQYWSIPYIPLVGENDIHPIPTMDPTFDPARNSIIEAPPTPNWNPNAKVDNTNWHLYWEDMGRHIWNVVITASHH